MKAYFYKLKDLRDLAKVNSEGHIFHFQLNNIHFYYTVTINYDNVLYFYAISDKPNLGFIGLGPNGNLKFEDKHKPGYVSVIDLEIDPFLEEEFKQKFNKLPIINKRGGKKHNARRSN